MSVTRFPHESDADYVERLAKADVKVPPGTYAIDRTIHLEGHAIVGTLTPDAKRR